MNLEQNQQHLLKARMDALTSQINPHFLFNTLNTVSSLIRFDPDMARGVVLKQSATDLLVRSIHKVHGGEIWLDNHMTAEVMKAFSKSSDGGPRREKPLLSDREKEIVQLVAQGYRNKEIGEKLFISEQTVKNHLHNIFDKLGVSDRLELALYAIHHRLIDQA